MAAVILIVIGAVRGLFILKVWQGRQWSRVLLTVLGSLGCLFSLVQLVSSMLSSGGALDVLLHVFRIGFVLAAFFAMCSAEAEPCFRRPPANQR